jgi:ParB-like nuclease domain
MRMRIRDLTVVMVPASSLKPDLRNPRTHSRRQIRQIANSTKAFGWANPIIVGADCHVLAGHGGLEAADLLGIDLDRLMSGELAQMVFTDPPSNVPINSQGVGTGGGTPRRVRDGHRRDDGGRVRCVPRDSACWAGRTTAPSISYAWTGGTSPSCSLPWWNALFDR